MSRMVGFGVRVSMADWRVECEPMPATLPVTQALIDLETQYGAPTTTRSTW